MEHPVRRVVTRSKGRVVGYYYSSKARKLIPWESQLERDCYKLLDLLPNVDRFFAQPCIAITDDVSGQRKYYPDILVKMTEGLKVIEVKPLDELHKQENRLKFSRVKKWAYDRGYEFEVWTERHVRREPLKSNIEMLHSYRLVGAVQSKLDVLCRLFSQRRDISLGEVCDAIGCSGDLTSALPYVAEGMLIIDFDLPISLNSLAELNFEEFEL
ncbi:TnsA endonuclease N-terminal domain-containing protein [Thalassospira alkalitolerans]|uniref:TnsA endonuclease N-terminal domain-containing protein n=1 Tax=Thalassospira alkalitolerans TaxID=1293890 RepID=A0A1Y2L6J3_9PROT|nr:TnsA endonuclease N-terminal domain-containing protein [Thalassospira alkalitolerans]OSQ42816.1 hypothetical protein TALK_21185 [Thalassospira alkalitolerans]